MEQQGSSLNEGPGNRPPEKAMGTESEKGLDLESLTKQYEAALKAFDQANIEDKGALLLDLARLQKKMKLARQQSGNISVNTTGGAADRTNQGLTVGSMEHEFGEGPRSLRGRHLVGRIGERERALDALGDGFDRLTPEARAARTAEASEIRGELRELKKQLRQLMGDQGDTGEVLKGVDGHMRDIGEFFSRDGQRPRDDGNEDVEDQGDRGERYPFRGRG
jgi:hypothetical protein